LKGLRILVVDDNAASANTTAMQLRMCGHEATVACADCAAIDKLHEFSPDVVLLDGELSLPCGNDLANRLKWDGAAKNPFIIGITGDSGVEEQRCSTEPGIDLFMVRPINLADLLPLLRRFQRVLG